MPGFFQRNVFQNNVFQVTNAYALTASAGAVAVAGQPANLKKGFYLAANAAALSVSGVAASFLAGRRLIAAAGSYPVAGQTAILQASRAIGANTSAYVVTGYAAGLIKTGSYAITANAGIFTIAGMDAGVLYARRFVAGTGAYTITGFASGTLYTRVLTASVGAIVINGQAANLVYEPSSPVNPTRRSVVYFYEEEHRRTKKAERRSKTKAPAKNAVAKRLAAQRDTVQPIKTALDITTSDIQGRELAEKAAVQARIDARIREVQELANAAAVLHALQEREEAERLLTLSIESQRLAEIEEERLMITLIQADIEFQQQIIEAYLQLA